MKKAVSLLMACMLLFSISACGSSNTSGDEPSDLSASPQQSEPSAVASPVSPGPDASPTGSTASSKALVVYFSNTGNTRAVAETIAEIQGADLYEIIAEQPYTDGDLNYSDNSTRATVEQKDESARPAISGEIENLDAYDVIYVGYPIWWGALPRIMYTFFDVYDFSGKTIAPFCTSGSSGLSGTPGTVQELETGATVLEGLSVTGSSVDDSERAVTGWLTEIGLSE